jgi:hypothetical protein
VVGKGWYLRFSEFEFEFVISRDLELEPDDLELEPDDLEPELGLDRDLELELGLDRDLSLPLSGAPGGDDGVLDPMSLPGAADDLDGLLDGARRVRFEFEFDRVPKRAQ